MHAASGANGWAPLPPPNAPLPKGRHALPPGVVSTVQRERLIRAMLLEAGDRGYDSTSVQRVLERAGTSRRAFYENFANKEECFLAAYRATGGDVIERMSIAASDQREWRLRLRAALDALLSFLDDEPAIAGALFIEVHAAGASAAHARIDLMRRMAALVSPSAATDRNEGRLNGGDVGRSSMTADGVVGGIDSAIRNRLRDETGWSCSELLPELMYFAVLAYEGPEAAVAELDRVTSSN